MGDRISIQFENGGEKSIVLFSHWGGRNFLKEAKEYIKNLPKKDSYSPLSRREPQTIMVDFVRHITKSFDRIDGDFYFGATENDGDNSDNGHFIIKLR